MQRAIGVGTSMNEPMVAKTANYEDATLLTGSKDPGFFDKSIGIRIVLGLIFTFVLFLCLHFREVSIDTLELNTIAPRYVVAQIDFIFLDDEATIILRQEAVREIGKVYQLDENAVRQRRTDFEKFLLADQQWRERIPDSTLEEMYRAADLLERTLLSLRFTDPRTLIRMEDVGLSVQGYQVYTPGDLSNQVKLPAQIWNYVQENTFGQEAFPAGVATFILDYFKANPWKLSEDAAPQRTLRKRLQGRVPDKYTHVSAGSRIIDQGEKVTTRHIAMLQAMKKSLGESRNLWHPATLTGSALLALMLTLMCAAFLQVTQPKVMKSNRQLCLLITVLMLTLGLAKVVEFFLLTTSGNLLEAVKYPLLVPFAAILLGSLMNFNIAAFSTVFLSVVLAIMLPFVKQGFMLTNLLAAIVAILGGRSLRKRKEIFVVCFKAWVCCIIMILSFHLSSNSYRDAGMWTDFLSTGLFMGVTAILVVGLLPLLESGFNIMTNVTLMEYMDPSHPVLRRMTIEAPGTYQHSLVVCNLAEAAAAAIGANGLFCRVATLFHDIGKMVTPQYFTENQQGGMNIHQLLTPLESAQVIMAHVKEGVAMARKAGLPEKFIDIIQEHHGTTLVYYFYRKQLELMGGDTSKVDQKDFRYSGPKPQTKESAIIMIADSFEAASRSLERADEATLMELVTRLVREKAEDGQFDECNLTFEELNTIKRVLVNTLVAAGHSRVKYPTRPATGG